LMIVTGKVKDCEIRLIDVIDRLLNQLLY